MTFDQFGYLTPYELIETDLETFEQVFVNAFNGSDTRKIIFKAYLDYLDQLQQIIGKEFYQWIDGSFITKKQNPNDIDFVTFVTYDLYKSNESQLNELRKLRYSGAKLLDNYFVPVFGKNSNRYFEFEADRLDWLHRFEKDNRKRNNHKKGFLNLNF